MQRTIDELMNASEPIAEQPEPAPEPAGDPPVRRKSRAEMADERYRRDVAEDEATRSERQRHAGQGRADVASLEQRIVANVDQRIANVKSDADRHCRAIAEATAEHIADHRRRIDELRAENTELKLAQAKLETRLAELELKLVTAGRTIDLPSLRAVQ
ncbi:hypothetical protein Q2941_32515 [Bradyrhizobium sp. UFLA05-153]